MVEAEAQADLPGAGEVASVVGVEEAMVVDTVAVGMEEDTERLEEEGEEGEEEEDTVVVSEGAVAEATLLTDHQRLPADQYAYMKLPLLSSISFKEYGPNDGSYGLVRLRLGVKIGLA